MIRFFTRSLLLLYGLAISSAALLNLGHEILHEIRNEFHHHSHDHHHRLSDHHSLTDTAANNHDNNVEIVLYTCFTFYQATFLFSTPLDGRQLSFAEKLFGKTEDGYRSLITPPPLFHFSSH